MAIKVSTGLANELTDRTCLRTNITGGRLFLFSGAQVANADTASGGTLLAVLTQNSGTFSAETLPVWTVVLAGSAGSVDTIKIGGIDIMSGPVSFATDLTTTAAAVAANITAHYALVDFTATSSGANVLISGPKGSGSLLNSMVCATTVTTMTATPSSSGAPTTAGVDAANGLTFSFPADSGRVTMSGTWSGLGLAAGTVGMARYVCDGGDAGTASSTTYRRIDGTVTVTGGAGDFTIDNTNVAVGQTITATGIYFGTSKG